MPRCTCWECRPLKKPPGIIQDRIDRAANSQPLRRWSCNRLRRPNFLNEFADASPIIVETVDVWNGRIIADPPLVFHPRVIPELGYMISVDDDDLNIREAAYTREELIRNILHCISFDWQFFAMEDPLRLTDEARAFVEQLRKRFKIDVNYS